MKKSRHNLSHDKLLTCDIGQLVPFSCVEVLPGDEFRANSNATVRLSPLAAPVMHGLSIRVHHFFVPHRLNMPEWEDFITGGNDGMNADSIPQVPLSGVAGDMLDYLGLPTEAVAVGASVSALPLMAVNLIFNEWYRDQDLVTARTLTDTSIPNVAYGRDYYNTARPWPQRGEEVTLPLGDKAPITGLGVINPATYTSVNVRETGKTGGTTYDSGTTTNSTAAQQVVAEEDSSNPGWPGIWADLSQATAATINSLRRASGLQRFMEERARYGARYSEYVRRAFGATPLDSRLQRPEFLAGGTQRVGISEVLQTAPESTPRFGVGDMYGHGLGMARSNRYKVRFREHGYAVSLFSVRPTPVYTNGIERHFLHTTKEDFYTKELAHIGQQQVRQQEVYATASNKDAVFGWSDRYAEYRNARSHACGEFRTTLDYWHLARKFASEPALNQAFIEVNPADTKRIFNEQTQHSLWVAAHHSIQARRVVPKNATARLL